MRAGIRGAGGGGPLADGAGGGADEVEEEGDKRAGAGFRVVDAVGAGEVEEVTPLLCNPNAAANDNDVAVEDDVGLLGTLPPRV